jgi:hypothetical protein
VSIAGHDVDADFVGTGSLLVGGVLITVGVAAARARRR